MIDSHCHLADEAFDGDLEQVVERARGAGVGAALSMVDPTSEAEGRRAARAVALWPALRFAVGVHPHQAAAFAQDPASVEEVLQRALAATARVAAIGEIGLDYHYDFAPRALQREVFARQLRLARGLGRPVVIHTREADDDTLDVLRAEGGGAVAGVLHCFTGDAAFARRGLDLGLHVSFSGHHHVPQCRHGAECGGVGAGRPPAGRDRRAVPGAGAAPGEAQRAGVGRAGGRGAGRGSRQLPGARRGRVGRRLRGALRRGSVNAAKGLAC